MEKLCIFFLVGCLISTASGQIFLSGYDVLLNRTGTLLDDPNGNQVNDYFAIYYKVIPPLLQVGIVCFSVGWCGFGISSSGFMVNPPMQSDVTLGYVDAQGNVTVNDFAIRGRSAPLLCAGTPGVCLDSLTAGCADNVVMLRGSRVGMYQSFEFTRPLIASDACDLAVTLDQQIYIIYSWANLTTAAWPNSVIKHNAKASTPDQIIIGSVTTGVATSGAVTSAGLTTAPLTTALPMTTAPVPFTTGLTTATFTTAPLTSSPLTTSPVTTSLTTELSVLTTSPLTTESLPATTAAETTEAGTTAAQVSVSEKCTVSLGLIVLSLSAFL